MGWRGVVASGHAGCVAVKELALLSEASEVCHTRKLDCKILTMLL